MYVTSFGFVDGILGCGRGGVSGGGGDDGIPPGGVDVLALGFNNELTKTSEFGRPPDGEGGTF